MVRFAAGWGRVWICGGLLALQSGTASGEGPLGTEAFGYVLILEDQDDHQNDHLDTFHTRTEAFVDAHLTLPTAVSRLRLIDADAPARFLIPRDGSLGSEWTALDFDDGEWQEGENGLGYDADRTVRPFDPVAYWPMEGTAEDATGQGRDGVLEGTASYAAGAPAGDSLSSLSLDGSGALLRAPGYTGIGGPGARTVAAWIQTTLQDAAIVSWGTNASTRKWTFRVQSGAGVAGAIRLEVNGGHIVGTTVVSDGAWHHVAAVFPEDATPNVDDVRLYVDGALDGEFLGDPEPSSVNSHAVDTAPQEDVRIGTDFNGRHFNGLIDEVAVWDRALSARQIADLASGVSPLDLVEGGEVGDRVRTDVSAAMAGRTGSLYARWKFPFDGPVEASVVVLRVRYDDGFIAFVNGREVARSNAPTSAAWSSLATADRVDREADLHATFETSLPRGALEVGENVLAIHALNSAAEDPTFLIQAELFAATPRWTAESITEGEAPGVAYVLSQEGGLLEVDWYRGASRQIASLGPLLPAGVRHTRFDSITRLPGSPLLYILRTDRGLGSPNEVDFIDVFDPTPGAVEPYVRDVYRTQNTGTISISEGPPFASFGPGPALYTIATGGSFEAFDPRAPSTPPVVIRTGRPAGTEGDLVSLTWAPGLDDRMYVLQDHDGASAEDRIHGYDLLGGLETNAYGVTHTGASSITESPRSGFVYSQATGGSVAHVRAASGQGGVQDLTGGVSSNAVSVAAVSPTADLEEFVYIADDRGADHLDLHDVRYTWAAGSEDAVLSVPAGTAPADGDDWADASLTDGAGVLWLLYSDGRLVRIEPPTGQHEVVAELFPPGDSLDRSTYESITDLPGDTRLFILRTDRPVTQKTGGGLTDRIDTYDVVNGEYVPDVFVSRGTGLISLTDGPPYNAGDVATGSRPAVYAIATGGSFEVLDPEASGATTQIRSSLSGADGGGSMISITGLPGDSEHLYVLRDRSGGDGRDRLDVLDLLGGARFDALELNGTGAKSIADVGFGRLFTVATGGACNLIEVDLQDVSRSLVHQFTDGTATHQCSVTRLSPAGPSAPVFRRGDVDDNGSVNITDAVTLLNWLFVSGSEPTCLETADTDDDGIINLTDAIQILTYLFSGGPEPAPPSPEGPCGPDPTGDHGCDAYSSC